MNKKLKFAIEEMNYGTPRNPKLPKNNDGVITLIFSTACC